MTPLRRLLDRPALAALIVAAALLLRLLVPAGYMPVAADGRLIVAVCSGTAPAPPSHAMPMGHGGAAATHAGHRDDGPPAPESPCAFADLALPMVGGADPVLLLAAILFASAVAMRLPAAVAHQTPRRLRPPSHAPPFPA